MLAGSKACRSYLLPTISYLLTSARLTHHIHQRRADGTIEVQHPASGLVTAVEPVLRACSGVWIAHGSGSAVRESICRNMEWAGIALDPHKNQVRGKEEKISSVESDSEIWIVPTNEELIVARQAVAVLSAN